MGKTLSPLLLEAVATAYRGRGRYRYRGRNCLSDHQSIPISIPIPTPERDSGPSHATRMAALSGPCAPQTPHFTDRCRYAIKSITPPLGRRSLSRRSIRLAFDHITFDPQIMGGKACIRGLRVTILLIVNFVANGMTAEHIIDAYPYLENAGFLQDLQWSD